MTDKVILALIGLMVILANAILVGFRIQDKREVQRNGGLSSTKIAQILESNQAGTSPMCIEHNGSIKVIQSDISTVKKDVEKIDKKIDKNLETATKILDEINSK